MKNIALNLLLPLIGLNSMMASAQVTLTSYALTDVSIIDANHLKPLLGQTIVIEGNKIVQIFSDGTRRLADSMTIFPLGGKYLIPGLIDTHVHMATDPSETDNRAATLNVLHNMLFSGITSVRDMAGDARTLASLSRDAYTGDILSPDIYYSALMAGPQFFSDPRSIATARGGIAGHMPYMLGVTDSTDLGVAMAQAKGTGAWGIKLYANLSAALVIKIVTEAKKQGLLVWGHAWLSPAKPSEMVMAGVSSISHAPLLVYDKMDSIPSSWEKGIHPAKFWDDSIPAIPETFRLMKTHNCILDATLSACDKWARENHAFQYYYEITKRMTARAHQAGVKICAGTDDDQEGFVQHEMQLLVRDAGFSPADALVAATLYGAEALAIDKTHGTVEINKIADLVVLDKNPLDNIDNIKSVFMVIKSGKVFKK